MFFGVKQCFRWVGRAGLALLLVVGLLTGCATKSESDRIREQQASTIQALNEEIARLNQELDALLASREDLQRAKNDLEAKLKTELDSGNLAVSMESRGLVVTVLDRVLFDSGKSEIKISAQETLDKVAGILGDKVQNHIIYVEGHTDNIPIRYSNWRSNWELSTGRSTEVIHHFIDNGGLDPHRFVAVGYGEFHPLVANDTAANRQKNRRVEIVISPKKMGDTKKT